MRTDQQPTTTSTRPAGRNAFACAAATVAAGRGVFALHLDGFEPKPSMHGDRDPCRHPGQQDV